MARQSKAVVCIDFALDQLRVIEVQNDIVTGYFRRSLAQGSLRAGDPIEPDLIGAELRQCMSAMGMDGVEARLALPDEAAVAKVIQLPRMPARHLRKAVVYSVERELPFPARQAAWSWEVVQRDVNSTSVYLVAAWRDIVDRVVEVATSAGLTPTLVEPRALAVARVVGLPRATILEAGGSQLQLTQLLPGGAPFVDIGILPADQHEAAEAIERLIQRSQRHRLGFDDLEASPVMLAGELEEAGLQLSVPAAMLSSVLNGHPPLRPAGMQGGHYLAALGLAMWN